MITYKGKSYVSDKMLNGECQGIHWTGAMVSDVNPATRLNGMCVSVMMGEKNIYGVDKSLLDLLIQYPALGDLLIQYPALGEFVVEHPQYAPMALQIGINKYATPRLAIDANDNYDERKWLIRAENNYTDWYELDNVLSQTNFEYVLGGITPTNNYVSKVGNTAYANGTIVKFFIPTTMPTGYSKWFADGLDIRINGTQILYTTSYHNNRQDTQYDFSNIIKLNKVNYIILRWWGSGNHGFDFGLLG